MQQAWGWEEVTYWIYYMRDEETLSLTLRVPAYATGLEPTGNTFNSYIMCWIVDQRHK